MATIVHQVIWHFVNITNQINDVGFDCGTWHRVKACRIRGLHNHQSAGVMNFLRSPRSIAARTAQHNRNRVLAAVLSQRSKEIVNRQVQSPCLLLLMQNQSAIGNRKVFFGRNQIDFIRGKFDTIGHTMNLHPGMTSKQFVHQAFEIWRKMLNDDESHACIGGHISKEFFDWFQPTR